MLYNCSDVQCFFVVNDDLPKSVQIYLVSLTADNRLLDDG